MVYYPRSNKTGRSIHRIIAYYQIYLKNREKYPLPFAKYEVHHKRYGNNITAKDLEILTPEEHRARHPEHYLSSNYSTNWGNWILFLTIAILLLIALSAMLIDKKTNINNPIQKNVNNNSTSATPPVFQFQASQRTDVEIKQEIADKLAEYDGATTSSMARISVYNLASAWNLPSPTKSYSGQPCAFTFEIVGVNVLVKVTFQADCIGGRNKNGYTIEVIR